jgi:hypothetical protein
VLVVVALTLTACEARRAASAPSSDAVAPGTVWRTLGSWNGRGDRQTESFDIGTGALRLAWEGHGESSSSEGHLRVTLHSAISGRPLETVVDHHGGAGGDTAYIAAEPRVAYLLVESERLDWRLALQEGAPPDPATTTHE